MSQSIGDLLKLSNRLGSISDSPELDVQTILSHVLGKSRSYLYAHPELELQDLQANTFFDLLARRQNGEPVVYLTGSKGFWNIELNVDPNVLIPRPETELLVELALSFDQDKIRSVVDLGTGTGAIAISLAKARPYWNVSATDKSATAIATARSNALINDADIHFIKGHWCRPLTGMRFDLIVSNPPYIRADDPHLSQPELKYEPADALISGIDGFAALREIILTARQHLNPDGWIILEHGYDQSNKVCDMLGNNGYHAIEPYKDIAKTDRAVVARFDSTRQN